MRVKMVVLGAVVSALLAVQVGVPAPAGAATTDPSVIDVWYGDGQVFGANGTPQVWIDLLGRLTDRSGLTSFTFQLNGGAQQALSLGPDGYRLQNPGDFDAQIPISSLQAGQNTVIFRATYGGQVAQKTITFTWVPNQPTPLPYGIDWSQVSRINDVAQVVDGKWGLVPGGVRTLETGYDRLIAIGSTAWTDYEVTVPVTLNGPANCLPGSLCYDRDGGPAVGILLRWDGHNADTSQGLPAQPASEPWPYGNLGVYRNVPSGAFQFLGSPRTEGVVASTPGSFSPGTTLIMKMRVEGFRYRFKAWPAGTSEPGWMLDNMQGGGPDPANGSMLLVAHHFDVTFGTVSVTTPGQPVANDDAATVAEGGTIDINVLANDAPGDGSFGAITITQAPQHGTATVVSGKIRYVHNGSETTSDTIVYRFNNGTFDSNTAAVSIGVTPVNDPPVASNVQAATAAGESVLIPIVASDPEGSPLTPQIVTPPSRGTAAVEGSAIRYTNTQPAANDTFTYRVSDGVLQSNIATVSVSIDSGAAATVALVDPASGQWHVRNQDGSETTFFYGVPGDLPIVGDWNCDGIDTPGAYRQSNGYVYLRNTNTTGPGDVRFYLGIAGDIPLAGDFDRNGCDTVSVYRPSEGRAYITNVLGANDGFFVAQYDFYFGNPGDRPFVGDFDGDGSSSLGLYRDSTGFVYFRNSLTQGTAESQFFYGVPSDRILAGDWDGNGTETVGIFRPADATFYLQNANKQGFADIVITFGKGAWLPVEGHFS